MWARARAGPGRGCGPDPETRVQAGPRPGGSAAGAFALAQTACGVLLYEAFRPDPAGEGARLAALEAAAIAVRLADLRARIAAAAGRSGRDPSAVRLVGASKTVSAEVLALAFRAGLRDFGENRVQEAEFKVPALRQALGPEPGGAGSTDGTGEPGGAAGPIWHLIGHLQTNKAARAARLFAWVQSVDSERVAEALDRHAAEAGRTLDVLVEVNASGEEAKSGVAPAQAVALVGLVACRPRLAVRGFMTVGPLVARAEEGRPAYRLLARLLGEARAVHPALALGELSMGMSADFEVAIEEGATIVRLGSALFGPRPGALQAGP